MLRLQCYICYTLNCVLADGVGSWLVGMYRWENKLMEWRHLFGKHVLKQIDAIVGVRTG